MEQIYAFEWCSCIYESGFSVESLHKTKAGAYKAMRKTLLERYAEDTSQERYWRQRFRPLGSQRWRVRTITLKD